MKPRYPLLRVDVTARSATVRTPAKLNLFLEVEGRRVDGFHDITTLMVPIDFCDRIRVEEARAGAEDTLAIDGSAASGVPRGPENLVLRALALMREMRQIPPLSITLSKEVPPESGLGGGSANAAGMLGLLDELFSPAHSPPYLRQLAARLGSDVPFFLSDGPQVARGRGDQLTPVGDALFGGEQPVFLLILSNVRSSTARAYQGLTFPLTLPDGPTNFEITTFVGGKASRELPGESPIAPPSETSVEKSSKNWRRDAKSGADCEAPSTHDPSSLSRSQRIANAESVAGKPSHRQTEAGGNVPLRDVAAPSHGSGWVQGLFNRLERVVLRAHPELQTLAGWLEGQVSGRWRMTGSGSAFYVVCSGVEEGKSLARRVVTETSLRALSLRTLPVRPLALGSLRSTH